MVASDDVPKHVREVREMVERDIDKALMYAETMQRFAQEVMQHTPREVKSLTGRPTSYDDVLRYFRSAAVDGMNTVSDYHEYLRGEREYQDVRRLSDDIHSND